ncbi:hypothetical protein [Legionella quateirensis]|uniref:Uncharacterized protein n=1 Tax=Legionella quateirensis TaxID=45072 RepID=A0A378KSN4_9GAMM|nr:hypothetical protein [Legionella quateirensis]KTD52872.1 hypothetical protein Lqua_0705 [Legionella quateirensis]STY16398.1 Uncharacterised protein [Legionella quateirensis]
MQKCYIQYAITSKNVLIISCYHNQISAAAAFVDLKKKYHDTNTLLPLKISEDIPSEEHQIGEVVIEQLKKIQSYVTAQQTVITSVYYAGDVNLGFGGRSKFPLFLLNDTISQLFKNHHLMSEVPIHLSLESANEDIVKDATAIYLEQYAASHESTFPNSPVIIQQKKGSLSVPNSSTPLKKMDVVPNDSRQNNLGLTKQMTQTVPQAFFTQVVAVNKPDIIVRNDSSCAELRIN